MLRYRQRGGRPGLGRGRARKRWLQDRCQGWGGDGPGQANVGPEVEPRGEGKRHAIGSYGSSAQQICRTRSRSAVDPVKAIGEIRRKPTRNQIVQSQAGLKGLEIHVLGIEKSKIGICAGGNFFGHTEIEIRKQRCSIRNPGHAETGRQTLSETAVQLGGLPQFGDRNTRVIGHPGTAAARVKRQTRARRQ